MPRPPVTTLTLTAAIALAPTIAAAHTGLGDAHDLTHGFMHPLRGLDHVLAMVAVGLLAARLGGRALWLVPPAFVVAMAAAGVVAALGVTIPFVETGIALSVVVLGAAIAFEITMPVAAAMAMVGFFAIFHGHAHGAEMPASVSGLAYGLGFVAATALLHGAGVALGLLTGSAAPAQRVARYAGGAITLAGIGLLASAV